MQSKVLHYWNRAQGQVQTPGRNGFADNGVFCVYFEDGVHFYKRRNLNKLGAKEYIPPWWRYQQTHRKAGTLRIANLRIGY